MLMFSLAIQALVRLITRECNLLLNRWYAEDGTLICTTAEVTKAPRNMKYSETGGGFHINVSRSRAYCPSMTSTALCPFLGTLPLHTPDEGGLVLLGSPLGNDTFVKAHLETKIESCIEALRPLPDIPDARMRFHLHRVTGPACRVEHDSRLNPRTLPPACRLL